MTQSFDTVKLDTSTFENLYLKAKHSYYKCVLDPDNDFLKDEIKVPIEEIILKEDSIRLQFFASDTDKFIVEVKLTLFSLAAHPIGYYTYYEDQSRTQTDDSLIFY